MMAGDDGATDAAWATRGDAARTDLDSCGVGRVLVRGTGGGGGGGVGGAFVPDRRVTLTDDVAGATAVSAPPVGAPPVVADGPWAARDATLGSGTESGC